MLRKTSIRRQLEALVILPSRELAIQVYGVIAKLLVGTHLVAYNSVGHTNFYEEQQILVGPSKKRKLQQYESSNSYLTNDNLYIDNSSIYSNINILVCTPSRLLDHIHETKGFSLEHLRFLILDEADRLLGNAYNYWVKSLIDATRGVMTDQISHLDIDNTPIFDRPKIQRLLFSATLTDNPKKLGALGIRNPTIIRVGALNEKYEISASTNKHEEDEDEHEADNSNPIFTLPSTLSESIRICDTADRPLLLISALMECLSESSSAEEAPRNDTKLSYIKAITVSKCDGNMCMIFASSVDTTHRLCTLLQVFNGQRSFDGKDTFNTSVTSLRFGGRVEEISRMMNVTSREKTLRDAAAGKVKVLVSSDNMARGIDLGNVKLVINYDPPKYLKTYVHRAGRTARAHRSGHCLTLLKKGQVGAFKKIRLSLGDMKEETSIETVLRKFKVTQSLMQELMPSYQRALAQLESILHAESY